MKLASHPLLDSLCGEYLLGTLRGPARRRFERALAQEPLVKLAMNNVLAQFTPSYKHAVQVQPSAHVWKHIEHTLQLNPNAAALPDTAPRTGWLAMLWKQSWGIAVGLAMIGLLMIGAFNMAPQFLQPQIIVSSVVEGKQVSVILSSARGPLTLHGQLGVLAQADQSYELWLVPANGSAPQSLGLLHTLDISPVKTIDLLTQIRGGAKLAVSIEPKRGSPTGGPTGPVTVLSTSS